MRDWPYVSLIGRILLGLIFLVSGLHKIGDPQGTQQYMAAMGMSWMTPLLYAGAIVVELAGGISLLLGYQTRAGAWLLFLFMIPTTVIFHTNFGDPNQMIHFLKNLAIMGGLLYAAVYGAGRLSMDAGMDENETSDTITRREFRRAVNQ